MKATHKAYARAYAALVETQASGDQEAEAAAAEALRAASQPFSDEIDSVWRRNVADVQAAKQACRDAITARATVEAEIAQAVNERLRDPVWLAKAADGDQPPLVTEAEQARLDAATAAQQQAIEANAAAEARFKQGVLPEQLAAS